MKEIEKKYLVSNIDITNYEYKDIEQAYLNIYPDPIIRIRKYGDDYFLTYKNKIETKNNINIADEFELPINKLVYEKLKNKVEGNIITKRRYIINLENDLIAELDIFEGYLNGLKTVEVEFKNENDYKTFKKPSWFKEDITKNKKYINSSLAKINSLKELEEENESISSK